MAHIIMRKVFDFGLSDTDFDFVRRFDYRIFCTELGKRLKRFSGTDIYDDLIVHFFLKQIVITYLKTDNEVGIVIGKQVQSLWNRKHCKYNCN